VSVVGSFNEWQVGAWPLACVRGGWWHGMLHLHPGRHYYRFWVEGHEPSKVQFVPDPENPARSESGYDTDHSVVIAVV
jgi:1,4-alpha-glucan branching enzyme